MKIMIRHSREQPVKVLEIDCRGMNGASDKIAVPVKPNETAEVFLQKARDRLKKKVTPEDLEELQIHTPGVLTAQSVLVRPLSPSEELHTVLEEMLPRMFFVAAQSNQPVAEESTSSGSSQSYLGVCVGTHMHNHT